jgi:hypothetical protein
VWKYLFAIVVSAAVITTSVYLYRHRDEMFRPDVQKLGGTRIAFAVEAGTPDDAYFTAMRRRFDPRGRLGVVVRRGDEGEVEILVPQGPAHDETVARVQRIAGRPGKFAFVPTASFTVDEGVSKHVMATYAGDKATPRSTPPPTPINSLGGREFPVSIAGTNPRRYRWIRLGEAATASFQFDPASLAGGNVAEKSSVDRAARTGALMRSNAQPDAMMLAARLPGEADPAFFLLVRDETDEHAIAATHIRQAEVEKEGRGPSTIRLHLDRDGFQRMAVIQEQQQNSIRAAPSPTSSRGSFHRLHLLAIVIDDRIAALPLNVVVQRPEVILEFGSSDEAGDDLVALLRSTPQGVRLSTKPTRVEAIEPKR